MTIEQEASERYGRALATYLAGGGRLQPVASAVPLLPGERCFGIVQGRLLLWTGTSQEGCWVPVDTVRLHVTDVRVLFDGLAGRTDLPLDAITSTAASADRLEVETTSRGRYGIAVPYPDYWHVLLSALVGGARPRSGPPIG